MGEILRGALAAELGWRDDRDMLKTLGDLGLGTDARIRRVLKCGPKNPSFVCACCDSGLRRGAVELASYSGGFVAVLVGKDCAARLLRLK